MQPNLAWHAFLRRFGGRRLAIFALFALAYFFSNFFRSANAVIAKDLAEEFSLSASELGLMTGLFYLVFAAVQLPLGGALDRVGPRWVTPALMLLAAAGSLVYAQAGSFAELAMGRTLIGAGMGGVLMGAYKAFSQWFSAGRFSTAAGLVVGLGALGSLATGAPLAWAAQTYGWRAVFLWSALGVMGSAAAIAGFVRNAPRGVPWPVAGAREARLREVFADHRFWHIAPLNLAVVGTLLSSQGLWSGPYLIDALGLTRLQAGSVITVAAVGGFFGYLLSGSLSDRFGHRRVVGAGITLFIAAQIGLAVVALASEWNGAGLGGADFGGADFISVAHVLYFVFGFGGAFNIMLMAHTRVVFPVSLTGRAVTTVNMFGLGGTALVQWSLGLLIESFGQDAAGRYPPTAYALAFGLTALLCVVALGWYAAMKDKKPSVHQGSPPTSEAC
jgi:MFS family permease